MYVQCVCVTNTVCHSIFVKIIFLELIKAFLPLKLNFYSETS